MIAELYRHFREGPPTMTTPGAIFLSRHLLASSDDPSAASQLFAVVLLVLFFGGIVAGVRALGRSAWKARRAQLAAYAAERGWQYRPGNVPGWARAFTATPFDAGVNRKARDMLSGVNGPHPFFSFEYLYIDKNLDGTGGREAARTFFFSVVAVQLDWTIPRTEFVPEGVGQKVAEFFGGKDLNVESHEFNRTWHVRTSDERAAHSLLTPRVIERMLAADFAGKHFFIESGFLVHYAETPRSEYEVDGMLALCTSFLDLVPDFVHKDYKRQG